MKRKYLVVGHNTPTDADYYEIDGEQGKLDHGVTAVFFETRKEAEQSLYWYQDGIIIEMEIPHDRVLS